jgi:hypothetical protein
MEDKRVDAQMRLYSRLRREAHGLTGMFSLLARFLSPFSSTRPYTVS